MYYEKLALEVGATVAGFDILKPPVIRGVSGVEHRFTFAATDGPQRYAFDVFSEAGEIELIRAYIKQMDTGAKVFVICLSGKPKDDASKQLSKSYGIDILGPKEVGDFFSTLIARKIQIPTKS